MRFVVLTSLYVNDLYPSCTHVAVTSSHFVIKIYPYSLQLSCKFPSVFTNLSENGIFNHIFIPFLWVVCWWWKYSDHKKLILYRGLSRVRSSLIINTFKFSIIYLIRFLYILKHFPNDIFIFLCGAIVKMTFSNGIFTFLTFIITAV